MKMKCLLIVVALCCLVSVGHAGLLTDAQTAVGGVAYGTPDAPWDTNATYTATVSGADGSSLTWSSDYAWSQNNDAFGNPYFGGDKSDAANWDNGYCFDNDNWATPYADSRLNLTFSGLDALTEYNMVLAARGKGVTMWDGTANTFIDLNDWQYEWYDVGTYTGADLMGGLIGIEVDSVGTPSTGLENQRLEMDGVVLVAIPEPATFGLISFAGLAVLFVRRRLMI